MHGEPLQVAEEHGQQQGHLWTSDRHGMAREPCGGRPTEFVGQLSRTPPSRAAVKRRKDPRTRETRQPSSELRPYGYCYCRIERFSRTRRALRCTAGAYTLDTTEDRAAGARGIRIVALANTSAHVGRRRKGLIEPASEASLDIATNNATLRFLGPHVNEACQ
eukprot:scaffold118539_cov31-Tisochrysis_lutea.AAC.4